ncbi:MAG: hypothetical protein WA021_02845 [Minisyncoccia bacterium]
MKEEIPTNSEPNVDVPERITASAFLYKYYSDDFTTIHEELFTAPNHVLAMEKLEEKYPNYSYVARKKSLEDGFVTSKGRFVDRYEAMKIAKAQGQVEDNAKTRVFPILDSYSLKDESKPKDD